MRTTATITFLCIFVTQVHAGPKDAEELRQKVIRADEQLAKLARGIKSYKVTKIWNEMNNGKQSYHCRTVVKAIPEIGCIVCEQYEEVSIPKPYTRVSVRGMNSQYGFWLNQKASQGGKADAWLLLRHSPNTGYEQTAKSYLLDGSRDEKHGYRNVVNRVTTPLEIVTASDRFQLETIDNQAVNQGRVAVHFTYNESIYPYLDPQQTQVQKAKAKVQSVVTLDSELFYLPLEVTETATLDNGERQVVSHRFEYVKAPNGYPLIKKWDSTFRVEQTGRSGRHSEISESKDWAFPSLQERDLSLSAYGLPEPFGVEWPKPTPLYVWLLLASGILGVVALGSKWLLKRRARNIVPIPPGV